MTIFEELAKTLEIPYYKAIDVIRHKDKVLELLQEYSRLMEETKACINCGRALPTTYGLCPICSAKATEEKDAYVQRYLDRQAEDDDND